jgi:predicted rRNA methylase YqxC with S4 and FtsJ domains
VRTCCHFVYLQVYGIDVGYGQVAHKVRVDPRVTVIERFNLRYLTPRDLPCKVGKQA